MIHKDSTLIECTQSRIQSCIQPSMRQSMQLCTSIPCRDCTLTLTYMAIRPNEDVSYSVTQFQTRRRKFNRSSFLSSWVSTVWTLTYARAISTTLTTTKKTRRAILEHHLVELLYSGRQATGTLSTVSHLKEITSRAYVQTLCNLALISLEASSSRMKTIQSRTLDPTSIASVRCLSSAARSSETSARRF